MKTNEINSERIPWDSGPSTMTNEIAFEIGKGDYPRFYDMPRWSPNVETFKYVNFFEWSTAQQNGGMHENGQYYSNWSFYGSLKERCFENCEQKRHYIRGVLSSYAGSCTSNSISACFANSLETRNRVVRWLEEILNDKFFGVKTWFFSCHDEKSTIPNVSSFSLYADVEIVDFILSINRSNDTANQPTPTKK